MTDRIAVLGILLVAWIGATDVASAPQDVQLRVSEDATWDRTITLDLKDAAIPEVLELVFQIAEQPVRIDDCVRGTVSLKFENVSLRDALESISRMGSLRVRPMREGYRVDCGAADPVDRPPAEGQLLKFKLTDLTDRVAIARPSLLVHYDSLAEITVGSVQTEDLDGAGEFFPGDTRSNFRLRTYLREDGSDSHGGQLRGILEIATRDGLQARTMLMAARSFEVALPIGSADVRVAALSMGGKDFELTVSRPAHE